MGADTKLVLKILRYLFYGAWLWIVAIFLFGLLCFFLEGGPGIKNWYNTYLFRWYNYTALGIMFSSSCISILLRNGSTAIKNKKGKAMFAGQSEFSSLTAFTQDTNISSTAKEADTGNHPLPYEGLESGEGGGAGATGSWDESLSSDTGSDSTTSESSGGDSGGSSD